MASVHTPTTPSVHDTPVVTGLTTSSLHFKTESSPDALRRHVASNLASTTPTPDFPLSIHFRDISPLKDIVLHRGRARFRVKPYSITHAYLTGHGGTPTQRGPGSYDRASPAQGGSDLGDILACPFPGIVPEETDLSTPNVRRVRAKLLCVPADVPQPSMPLSSMSRRIEGLQSDEMASGLDVRMPGGTGAITETGPTYSEWDSEGEADGATPLSYNAASEAGYGFDSPNDPNDDMGSDISPFVGEAFVPVTVPLEYLHRRVRSPYFLRRNRYPTTSRIQQQVRAIGQPLDVLYLREAGIKKFKPSKRVVETNLDILFKCTTFMGFGISLTEFGKIMHACMECDRHIFVDSLTRHDCEADVQDVHAPDFSIMSAIHRPKCAGLTAEDIEQLFVVCDTCRRVYMHRFHTLHDCTDLGLAVEPTARRDGGDGDYTEH